MDDHRKLGRELDLFDSDPLIGAGLPYWLPAGAAIRHAIEQYMREAERLAGYQHVYSPVLAKRELFELSGHWAHYREDMFPPMRVGGEDLVLRPSLCPEHALMYRFRQHSYRALPVRIAELGAMFRSEASGVLAGLTRVRSIQLNDAHIFCRPDQVADEATSQPTTARNDRSWSTAASSAASNALSPTSPKSTPAHSRHGWPRSRSPSSWSPTSRYPQLAHWPTAWSSTAFAPSSPRPTGAPSAPVSATTASFPTSSSSARRRQPMTPCHYASGTEPVSTRCPPPGR